MPETERQMPRYKSHKEVSALKIKEVIGAERKNVGKEDEYCALLIFEDGGYAHKEVGHDYVVKHQPKAGGYYVRYEDGYESWSPAQAFEGGYTLI